MRKKTIICILLAFIVMASIFTGCEKSDQDVTKEESQEIVSVQETQEEKKEEEKNEPVEIRFSWWGSDSRHEGFTAATNAYMEQNLNVIVNIEPLPWDGYKDKLITQLASGSAADVIQVHKNWVSEDSFNYGVLYDLRELGDLPDTKDIPESLVKDYCYSIIDGSWQIMPLGSNINLMAWNVDFCSKFGVDPDQVWTWDSLIEFGKKIKESGAEDNYIISGDLNTIGNRLARKYMVQLAGGDVVSDDFVVNITEEQLEKVFQFVADAYEYNVYEPLDIVASRPEGGMSPIYKEMKGGAIVTETSVLMVDLEGAFPENSNVIVTAIPTIDGNPETGTTIDPNKGLGISANTKYPEECMDFINFFINSKEAAVAKGMADGIPSSPIQREAMAEAGLIPDLQAGAISKVLSQVNLGAKTNGLMSDSFLIEARDQLIEEMFYGVITPKEAAESYYQTLIDRATELKEG